MNLYLDTSSIIKLYLVEPGAEMVLALIDYAVKRTSSVVAYAESRSALARASAGRRLSRAEYQLALESFERDWNTIETIDVSALLAPLAGALAETHRLRGFDAIHLASALTLQTELAEPITFSASDDRLMTAAKAEGLTV